MMMEGEAVVQVDTKELFVRFLLDGSVAHGKLDVGVGCWVGLDEFGFGGIWHEVVVDEVVGDVVDVGLGDFLELL